MKLTGIVLAAGRSSRLGRDKLAVTMPGGRSLAAWALEAALGSSALANVVCVVKPEDDLRWVPSEWMGEAKARNGSVSARIRQTMLQLTACTDDREGMANSLRCGIQAAMQTRPEGVVILLADQPLLQSRHIDLVARVLAEDPLLDYSAAMDGTPGDFGKPPIAFRCHMMERLLLLHGDEGARTVLREPCYKGGQVILPDFSFWDADTEPQLARIIDFAERTQVK
ncbi:NTP transferase domain-containing protein [Paenibacillus sp. JJ-223]|uniref:nucleotidyltransferase family protein n=1 Tax=Paenibacillus sp. JJ-223 TaxID=2905647 RepID=UPI001F393E2C|nr:NTP transferase domain-containing protein [Paenibacillus sp. JJ-223]CAH1199499.1 Purine catabolism protein PucB [Paenibacillus sp. JJ-223]